jgi:hypothetical protein
MKPGCVCVCVCVLQLRIMENKVLQVTCISIGKLLKIKANMVQQVHIDQLYLAIS